MTELTSETGDKQDAAQAVERREKQRAYNKLWRERNPEKNRAYKAEWAKRNSEKQRAYRQAWAKRNPEKENARREAHLKRNPEKAEARRIARDRIPLPATCQQCHARGKLHRHHPDYSRPMLVEFLCAACHRRTHKEMREYLEAVAWFDRRAWLEDRATSGVEG